MDHPNSAEGYRVVGDCYHSHTVPVDLDADRFVEVREGAVPEVAEGGCILEA